MLHFDSYLYRESPSGIYPEEEMQPSLFAVRSIPTDRQHAARVLRKIVKCDPGAADLLRRGFSPVCRKRSCTSTVLW